LSLWLLQLNHSERQAAAASGSFSHFVKRSKGAPKKKAFHRAVHQRVLQTIDIEKHISMLEAIFVLPSTNFASIVLFIFLMNLLFSYGRRVTQQST